MKSNYLCPICDVALDLQDMMNGSIYAWCAYGNCPSRAANEGAESKTEEGAYHKIHRAIEIEVGQNNRHGPLCGCACCMSVSIKDWADVYE